MVLEIEMFRTPEGIAIVKESQRRRYKDLGLVDKVVEYDTAWRKGELLSVELGFRSTCSGRSHHVLNADAMGRGDGHGMTRYVMVICARQNLFRT